MSNTPETDAKWESECCSGKSWYHIAEEMKFFAINREIERNESQKEKDIFLEALMQIEETFVDGEDTYDSWKKMGDISRNALKDVKF